MELSFATSEISCFQHEASAMIGSQKNDCNALQSRMRPASTFFFTFAVILPKYAISTSSDFFLCKISVMSMTYSKHAASITWWVYSMRSKCLLFVRCNMQYVYKRPVICNFYIPIFDMQCKLCDTMLMKG